MGVIEEVFSIELPVGEQFRIQRCRYTPSSGETDKRISIVSGIHGDELEGQYVCFLLGEWLRDNREKITGTIDIYPAINSLGLDSITRSVPFYDVDLNRNFPGSKNDFLPAQIADGVVTAMKGSEIAIDIHSSNIFLREIPQVRIAKSQEAVLVPLANKLNIDFVWVHDAVTVLESTFAHAMNMEGTKTLVVEMGVGMRLSKMYGLQLLDGLLNLMACEGFLSINPLDVRMPIQSHVGEVAYLNASQPGLFVSAIEHCQIIEEGSIVGHIVDPLSGERLDEVIAPIAGVLFTLRAYPIVYEGSLVGRIFGEKR
ncbi:MAG: M14 family metallopeptidase [Sulfuricurvum sp.]|uniref:M14 family metallopeptidase n=1 Tax=Sulfuricurvum sp. TaxID=2025608 RepID=UPI0025D9D224|nr:M14 family metallopeptidase [Sulfuricurvum sp.]MCK9373684.1 M14 family metallopeptidase [Sulfuricurvum sp.]